jgi:GntR family transcriptional regulator
VNPLQPVREPRVRRRDRVTLVQSCFEALSAAIESDSYRPGDRLPSEVELAEELAVSRPTLREALHLLEARGMVRREHGRGTFVRERPINKDLNRNFGITTMIRDAGYSPSVRGGVILSALADAELAEKLGLNRGDPIWQIERVRLADDRPVVLAIDSLSGRLASRDELDQLVSGEEQSLYAMLHRLRGIVIRRGEAELLPVRTRLKLRDRLELKPGVPVLCIKQVDFDSRDRPCVYSVEYHVADWVRFCLNRVGPGAGSIDT